MITLRVVICCEIDHDAPGYGIPAARFDVYKEKLCWKGVENIPKIREICNSSEDSEFDSVKITWLVRCDEQMKIVFDDYAYSLRNFRDLWKELKKQGDEIGWHPHFWRWNSKNKCWYQEVSDKKWMSRCLESGHKQFLKLAKNPTSMRMGWGFHNNFTMKKINDLGLTVDLSASPGLKNQGRPDERGSHFLNEYDWSTTPQEPYHPSQKDYRRPAKNNEKSLQILELPVTTAPKSKSNILVEEITRLAPISLRKRILKGADIRFKSIQHRFIANITLSSFKEIAKHKFMEAKQNQETHTNLVAIFHPIELFKPKASTNLKNNLMALTELSKQFKVPFRFLTATEMAKEVLSCLSS